MSVDLNDLADMSGDTGFTIDDIRGLKSAWDNYFSGDKKIEIRLREKVSNIAFAAIIGLSTCVVAYAAFEVAVLPSVCIGIVGFASTLIAKSIYSKFFGLSKPHKQIAMNQAKVKEFLEKFCTDRSYNNLASEDEKEVLRRHNKETDSDQSVIERGFVPKFDNERTPETEDDVIDGEPPLKVPASPPDPKDICLVSSQDDVEFIDINDNFFLKSN